MSFSPDKDIPDLSGKVILVTGGNSGLGKESLLQLAKHNPQQLIMGARNKSKAQDAITDIQKAVPNVNISFVEINLSSFASIKKAADTVCQQQERLDIIINNAGLMGVDASLTDDGYEIQLGSNHMGPALLTKLLMPLLERTAKLPNSDVRVVQLASEAHKFAPAEGIVFSKLKTPQSELSGRARYGQSKLANIYFIKALAKRNPDVTCVSIHPGLVSTNLFDSTQKGYSYVSWLFSLAKRLVFVDVQTGSLGQLWAATGSRDEIKSGTYYVPLKKDITGSKAINDTELAEKLWDWTEKEFKAHGL